MGCLVALEDSFEVVMLFEDVQVVGEEVIVLCVVGRCYLALEQLQPAFIRVDLLLLEEVVAARSHY